MRRKLGFVLAGIALVPRLSVAATQRIVTVKSSGGNYRSLAAAIAAESKDLVSLDRQLTIQCYASAAPDTAQVLIKATDGWVTDSTRYIEIVVPFSERHAGSFDPKKYYRALNDWEQGIAVIGVPYTRIEGVQFYVPPSTSHASYAVQLGGGSAHCLVDAVLIDSWYAFEQRHGIHITVSGGSVIRNSIIYGPFEAGIALYWEPVTIENVTIINTGLYGNGSYGIDWSTNARSGHVIRNVYCGRAATACFNGPRKGATLTTSASSDSTGTIQNVGVTSADFANISGPNVDLNIGANSALRGRGTNLSNIFTNDCGGRIRSAAWDIGACAFAGLSTAQPYKDGQGLH